MRDQLTPKDAVYLIKKHHSKLIKEVLDAMENTAILTKKYKSVKLTCDIWCKRREEDGWKPPLEPVAAPKTNEFVKKPQSLDYLNEAKK